jgi:Flp pilus assembly protein TadD
MTNGIVVSRQFLCVVAALAAIDLAACGTMNAPPPAPNAAGMAAAPVEPPLEEGKYVPSSEPLRSGMRHFNRGDYGLAERYFCDAVEKTPRDASAWIGLAASYDHVGRFDLADRAYRNAIKLVGETTEILNNQGYSYMLRGNLSAARAKLRQAYRRDPKNPTIVNNLQILNSQKR